MFYIYGVLFELFQGVFDVLILDVSLYLDEEDVFPGVSDQGS